MIFGPGRGFHSLSEDGRSGPAEVAILGCAQDGQERMRLGQIGDFLVEEGEGGFERGAMLGVGGGSKVIHDTNAR